MNITPKNIEELECLYSQHSDVLQEAEKKFTELRKTSKERTIERKDPEGNMQEIREYDAFEEATRLSWECESGIALKERYPDLYKLYVDQDKLKAEIKDYCVGKLGINPYKLTLLDVIKISKATAEMVK